MEPNAGTALSVHRTAFLPRNCAARRRFGAGCREKRRGVVAPAVTGPPQEALMGADLDDLPLPAGTYGWPVVGETVEFLNDMTAFAQKRVSQHGNVFKSHLFGSKSVIVCGAEALKKVVQLEANGTVVVRPLSPGLRLVGDNSVLVLNGAEHAHIRSLLHPAFSRESVAKVVPFIVNAAKETCAKIDGQGWLPINEEMRKYAFAVTIRSFLGIEFPSRSLDEVLRILEPFGEGLLTLGIDLPFTKYHKGVKSREAMDDIIAEAIGVMKERGPDDGRPARALKRILDARDEDGNGIRTAAVLDTVITILYAGYDTFSSVMDHALHTLALNPQIWDKLREEQRRVVQSHGDEITSESLAAMPYAEAVVNECLRTRPVAQFVQRCAAESFELEGYRIPRGWLVMFGAGFTMQHMDGRWSDAGAFRPERFLEPGVHKVDTIVPFGMGCHTCLGKELALIETRVMLSVLARWYEVRLRDPHADVTKIPVPHAVDGCMATVRKLPSAGI